MQMGSVQDGHLYLWGTETGYWEWWCPKILGTSFSRSCTNCFHPIKRQLTVALCRRTAMMKKGFTLRISFERVDFYLSVCVCVLKGFALLQSAHTYPQHCKCWFRIRICTIDFRKEIQIIRGLIINLPWILLSHWSLRWEWLCWS